LCTPPPQISQASATGACAWQASAIVRALSSTSVAATLRGGSARPSALQCASS